LWESCDERQRRLFRGGVFGQRAGGMFALRFYGESWQPEERGSTPTPRLLFAALLLKDNADIEVMNHAGATLIGWHDAKNSWALRAASTGGTHFLPVQTPAPVVRSACYAWGDTPLCSAGPKARHWSRVAVFRLTADRGTRSPPA
jgi:hypothetical protein